MRFYLASAFELRDKVQEICERLESLGHQVPVQWWDHSADAHELKASVGSDDDFYARKSVQLVAARDMGGVATCQVFVLIADSEPRKFNGANVELGFALALGKPCFAMGKLERSALYAHVVRVEDIEGVLKRFR